MKDLLKKTTNPTHQADVTRRDKAFEKDVEQYAKQLTILRRPQKQEERKLCAAPTPLEVQKPTFPAGPGKSTTAQKWVLRDI